MFDVDMLLLVLFTGRLFFKLGYNYNYMMKREEEEEEYLMEREEEEEYLMEREEEEYDPEDVTEAYEICSSLFKYL